MHRRRSSQRRPIRRRFCIEGLFFTVLGMALGYGTALGQAECDVRYYWSTGQRKLTVNEKPIRRLADYLGTLRTVVFCTEDLHLVKGSAKSRRRFLDLLWTPTQPGYLGLLHRYTESLRSRNALLKRDTPDAALLESFTTELIATGGKLMAARRGGALPASCVHQNEPCCEDTAR